MQDPADPMRLLIVCDMWLTGFDALCPAHHVLPEMAAGAQPHAGNRPRKPGVQDKPG
ncbi:hypothetical protein [Methanosarcina sp.]|uniref:hypothetical protein n=1 Tax=Methanosarcina sp. TaxID=2213 RepID=UPI002AB8928A|nr:hypothetical protein [Methanosarcina sp.]MDY9926139.1 hypothetical protein [Methanosarcina sp.]